MLARYFAHACVLVDWYDIMAAGWRVFWLYGRVARYVAVTARTPIQGRLYRVLREFVGAFLGRRKYDCRDQFTKLLEDQNPTN